MEREFGDLVDRQNGLYSKVSELIDRQEAALEEGDLSALLEILSAKQRLFDEMEENEKAISAAVEKEGGGDERKTVLEEMAGRVRTLLEREEKSLGALRNLKEKTVQSAGELQKAKRVMDAYKRSTGTDARFIDEDR